MMCWLGVVITGIRASCRSECHSELSYRHTLLFEKILGHPSLHPFVALGEEVVSNVVISCLQMAYEHNEQRNKSSQRNNSSSFPPHTRKSTTCVSCRPRSCPHTVSPSTWLPRVRTLPLTTHPSRQPVPEQVQRTKRSSSRPSRSPWCRMIGHRVIGKCKRVELCGGSRSSCLVLGGKRGDFVVACVSGFFHCFLYTVVLSLSSTTP